MKLFFTLLLIAVVIVAGYFYWESRSGKGDSSGGNGVALNGDEKPIQYTGTEEEQSAFIRNNVAESKAYLRTLSVALESFKVDHNNYPPNLFTLTSPVAYITQVPKDPFTQSSYMKYVNKGNDYVVWSIGPDLKNNDGSSKYNPAQGNKSTGDITRTNRGD